MSLESTYFPTSFPLTPNEATTSHLDNYNSSATVILASIPSLPKCIHAALFKTQDSTTLLKIPQWLLLTFRRKFNILHGLEGHLSSGGHSPPPITFDIVFCTDPHSLTRLLAHFQPYWLPALQESGRDKLVLRDSEQDTSSLPLLCNPRKAA